MGPSGNPIAPEQRKGKGEAADATGGDITGDSGESNQAVVSNMGIIGGGPILSDEETRTKAEEVLASPQVKEKINEACRLTMENDVEYAGWIIQDSVTGEYRIEEIHTQNLRREVTVPSKPDNAIGHFHTHTGLSTVPSPMDQNNKGVDFQVILNPFGDKTILDRNGWEIE